MSETTHQYWKSAEERIEAQVWVRFFARHSNVALRGCSVFLAELYDFEVESSAYSEPIRAHQIQGDQQQEILAWVQYFMKHSHPGLHELADWIPQWYPML